MEIELSGFVVVTYTTKGGDDEFALTFTADEFSSPDSDGGFDNSSGELTYQGVWNASEENVLLQLSVTAKRDGITKRIWNISAHGDEALLTPKVSEDKITVAFVED